MNDITSINLQEQCLQAIVVQVSPAAVALFPTTMDKVNPAPLKQYAKTVNANKSLVKMGNVIMLTT